MSKHNTIAALVIAFTSLQAGAAETAQAPQSHQQTQVMLPMLPGAAIAQAVVNTALTSSSQLVSQALSAQTAAKAVAKVPAKATPAQVSPAQVNKVQQMPLAVVQTRRSSTGRSQMVFSTAYNSDAGQTDGSPFITATGTRTRPGVLAVSRDLLRVFPYGTRVRLDDPSGRNPWLSGRTFIVEDTMNARFTNRVDLWMGSRAQALQWGGRSIRITAVQ